ncbi:Malonyl CoA-acyl carrier protein transacylase [Buchnera aphidicola (Neophyllaphis podocarpi)]|uniref:ACP S-malonyltransferase n=1 Tax=Buchnera aphidicola TaxID=9 RepID=UPI003463E14C
MKYAVIFPGQNFQSIKNLNNLAKKYSSIKKKFYEASDYLNCNLWNIIQNLDEKKINLNNYIQPIILTISVSIYNIWKQKKQKKPTIMVGHSLGEYSALVCSNSINFGDALKLIMIRSKLMQEVSIKNEGLMYAIVGIDKNIINNICNLVSNKEIVSIAAINSPDQVIISGNKNSIIKTIKICKNIGAKYVIKLPTKIPSHCILMKDISIIFKKKLKKIKFKNPKYLFIDNANAKFINSESDIKNSLVKQLYCPILWTEVMKLIEKKIFLSIEIGTKNILSNINKYLTKINSLTINNEKNLYTALKYILNKKENNKNV